MDESTANAQGVKPLREVLETRLLPHFPIVTPVFPGGSRSIRKENLVNALLASQALKSYPLFTLATMASPSVSGVNIPFIFSSGIGLGAKALYKDPSYTDVYEKVIAKALTFVTGSSVFKSSGKSWEEVAMKVVEFEIKLASFSPSVADVMETFGQTTTLAELESVAPAFPWKHFFTKAIAKTAPSYNLTPKSSIGIIGGIHYFSNISSLIQNADLDVIEPYLLWRNLQNLKPFAAKSVRQVFAPLDEKLTGVSSNVEIPRSDVCLDILKDHMGDAIGKWFVQKTFRSNSVAEAKVMMEGIKSA
ncbi:hypothetical protein HDV05_002681, partial [Chytridiales sp. JEL 0842]